jgi:NAD(P)-dependent dehydrogenase (short-subunit alcohol dehydrogenase family)
MKTSKDGNVAVVRGAAAGIGQAVAVRLAEDGARVALLDVGDSEATVALIEAIGGQSLPLRCDVTDEGSVTVAAAAIADGLGDASILANVAGIYPNAPFEQVTFEDWGKVMAINLDGPFLVSRAIVPAMRAAGSGRIVNVSSSTVGGTTPGFVPYIASKMGVIGLTRALANDLGDANITVNALALGLTRTAQTERMWEGTPAFDLAVGGQVIKRVEEPADIVGALSFLTSDEASFITGQTIAVDGAVMRL